MRTPRPTPPPTPRSSASSRPREAVWAAALQAELCPDQGALGRRARPFRPERTGSQTMAVFAVACLVGLGTALCGVYVELASGLLADARSGACTEGRAWVPKDRMRCCGGSNLVDHARGSCRGPIVVSFAMPEKIVLAAASLWPLLEPEDECSNGDCPPVMSESLQPHAGRTWIPFVDAVPPTGPLSLVPLAVYALGSLVLGQLAAGLICVVPHARGSGIPEFKASMAGVHIPMSWSPLTLCAKMVGLALSVGSGLPLGKEGPMVQIGACLAMLVASAYEALMGPLPLPRHELLAAGAAAGVSTAFGAPLGGIMFAVEESGGLASRALSAALLAAVVAAVTLQWIDLTGTHELTLYGVSYKAPWKSWEIGGFVLLGILGGLIGAGFVRLNAAVHESRLRCGNTKRSNNFRFCPWLPVFLPSAWSRRERKGPAARPWVQPLGEVAVLTLLVALTSYPMRLLRIMQNEAIHGLFATQCPTALHPDGAHDPLGLCHSSLADVVALVAAAGVIRFVQTAVTFGAPLPAGLFTPSLFVGACLGRGVGELLRGHADASVEPGVYAMVGAGAVLAGVTRITVSLVVVLFELTEGIPYVVPFLLAVLTAKTLGDSLSESVYSRHAVLGRLAVALEEPSHVVRFDATVLDLVERLSPTAKVVAADALLSVASLVSPGRDLEGVCVVAQHPARGCDFVGVGWCGQEQLHARLAQAEQSGACRSAVFRSTEFDPASDAVDLSDLLDARGLLVVRQDCAVATACAFFRSRPDLFALVCVGDGQILGALTRQAFMEGLTHLHVPCAKPRATESEMAKVV